jgi:hypothetical protein
VQFFFFWGRLKDNTYSNNPSIEDSEREDSEYSI